MLCSLFNVKKLQQNYQSGFSNLLVDRMYSVVAFGISVLEALSKGTSPERRMLLIVGSVFSNSFRSMSF